jgi:hypothetical protein
MHMTDDTRNKLNTIKHDANDTLDEVKERAQAAGERISRDVQGDDMPLGERVISNVKEAVHKTKADFDAAKRDVRHADDETETERA